MHDILARIMPPSGCKTVVVETVEENDCTSYPSGQDQEKLALKGWGEGGGESTVLSVLSYMQCKVVLISIQNSELVSVVIKDRVFFSLCYSHFRYPQATIDTPNLFVECGMYFLERHFPSGNFFITNQLFSN